MDAVNICLLVFAALSSCVHKGQSFKSSYDKPFQFVCQKGRSLVWTRSVHSNYYEDREFEFQCAPGPISEKCQWTWYVNEFDQPVNYKCPNNGAVTGLESYHVNYYDDRRWKIRCCALARAKRKNCKMTNYLNSYDGRIEYSVPEGHIIAGVHSVHNNYYEDRIWRFIICGIGEA